jgi:hypothetical protein
MPIRTVCAKCGKVAQAPDSAAGKRARCTGCGQIVSIPAAPSTASAKICTTCGIDVAGIKRTKDTAGRYYCGPCWQAKVEAGQAADLEQDRPVVAASKPPITATARMAVATASRPVAIAPAALPPPAPKDDDDFDFRFREDPEPASPVIRSNPRPIPALKSGDETLDTLEECRECGISFPASELVPDENDGVVCQACAFKEVSVAPLPLPMIPAYQPQYAPPPARTVVPYRTPTPKRKASSGASANHTAMMLRGGIVCGIGIVVTVGSYITAVSGHGGTYVVAWGAIIFGGIRFFAGLMGMLSG